MSPAVALQPAAREPGAPQPGDHGQAAAHEIPDQTGAVILYHQYHRPLIDTELVWRYPPARRAAVHAERLVERAPESIRPVLAAQRCARQATDSRDDDLGGEWKGREHDPGGDGAVVRAERGAAGDVVEELSLYPADHALHPAGAVAGSEPPAVLPITLELHRVLHRVRLLHEGRLAAVLEVVAATLPHEGVAEVAEVDPQVRELVGK